MQTHGHTYCLVACAEPDWCRNFETEQAIRARELELKRKKTVRSELNEKLDKLRGSDVLSDGNALRDAARRRRQGGRPSAGAGRAGGKRPREDDAQQHKAVQAGEDDQLAADYSDSETEVVDGPREARQRRSAFRTIGHGARRADKDGLPQLSEGAARSMSIADQIRAELAASEKSAAKAAQDAERSVNDRRKGGRADGPDGVQWSEEEELERAAFRPQILYVSRTHSQVTQFVHEIGKTVFGRDLRVVSLGSRKSLCVHPSVSLASDSRINEVCLEMQDKAKRSSSTAAPPDSVAGLPGAVAEASSSTSSSVVDQVRLLKAAHHDPIQAHTGAGCPFLAEPMAQNAYKDVLLARVRDVEESAALGEELKTCSYYGSRRAVKYAEVVAMPYSMLLHASTRASSGIDLRGAVVVIDEAHNVIDAINSSHASSVNSEQLSMAHATVRAYLAKYAQRMKPSNVQLCTALADAIAGILAYLAGREAVAASLEGIQQLVRPSPSSSDHGSVSRSTKVTSVTVTAQASKPLDPSVAAKATPAEPVEAVKMEATAAQRSVSPFASFFGGKPKPACSVVGAEEGRNLVSEASHSRGSTPQLAPDAPSAALHAPPAALVVPAAKPVSGVVPVVSLLAPSEPVQAAQLPALRALPGDTVLSITGFHTAAGISHVNLFRLRRYVDAVELLKKLRGFAEAGARAAAAATSVGASTSGSAGEVAIHGKPSQMKQNGSRAINSTPESAKSPATSYMSSVTAMQQCWSFLTSLLLTDEDGRVIVTVPPQRSTGAQQTGSVPQKKELPSARFVLLNPSLPFQEVVQKARSIILVGGTLQPVSDIVEQLFAAVPPTRMVKTFSCGHIIPRENLSCLTVAAGPSAVPFDFRHGTRGEARIIDELGRALVSLATLVPAGIVVFLPSFDYEMSVMQHWCRNHPQAGVQELQGSVRAKAAVHASLASTASDTYKILAQGGIPAGAPGSVLEQLQKRKAVFREPRSATQVDIVLKAYASVIAAAAGGAASSLGGGTLDQGASPIDSDNESIGGASLRSYSSHTGAGMGKGGVMSSSSSVAGGSVTSTSSLQQGGAGGGGRAQTGAILFCVVGGKMSEGINFADDMARCVVVVGLPFANPSDPELKERMEYLSKGGARGASKGAGTTTGSNKGSEYYENLCMRAVNQSIGRSIRHKDDYSLICLLDGRYAQQRIKGKLPGWIGDRIADTHTWGQVVSATAEFFRTKKAASSS